ncbi:MAG: hypothetical protein QOG69_952 [Actinomycetota bacterium]|nr:hypothetical protein [Actinomycetota bacterium]
MRKLRSGRFQARYCVGLTWHTGPTTFRTKREADAYLASVRTQVDRGAWIDPEARMIPLARYAERWMAQRPQLRPRTRELYEGQLRLRRSRRVWSRDDIGAEDVGVDDDQAPSGEVAHASRASEEGGALFLRQIVDHHVLVRRQRPSASQQLCSGKLQALAVTRTDGLGRHLPASVRTYDFPRDAQNPDLRRPAAHRVHFLGRLPSARQVCRSNSPAGTGTPGQA